MGTLADLLGNVSASSPWLIFVAGVLLIAAARIGGRIMASLQRIGARVGVLEQRANLERTRRRQVEAVLLEQGLQLPPWPEDPPIPYRPPAARPRYDDDGDLDDDGRRYTLAELDDPATAEVRRAPVPPFPPDESARLSRHRR